MMSINKSAFILLHRFGCFLRVSNKHGQILIQKHTNPRNVGSGNHINIDIISSIDWEDFIFRDFSFENHIPEWFIQIPKGFQ